jgi:hypothetical protein
LAPIVLSPESRSSPAMGLRKGDDPALPPIDFRCGDVRKDMENEEWSELTFRDACNKIVHAQQIAVERDGPPNRDVFDRIPEGFILRGMRNGKAWQAHLSLYDYIRASAMNFAQSVEP